MDDWFGVKPAMGEETGPGVGTGVGLGGVVAGERALTGGGMRSSRGGSALHQNRKCSDYLAWSFIRGQIRAGFHLKKKEQSMQLLPFVGDESAVLMREVSKSCSLRVGA